MKYPRPVAAAPREARLGFTLVEMLVVLAIVALLVALGAAGLFGWIGTQQQDTTETTMRAVFQRLAAQYKAVTDKANTETIPPNVVTMAGGDISRARVIWKKLRLKQEFPMTYAEALAPWQAAGSTLTAADLPAKQFFVRALQGKSTAAPTDGAQSSALLLLSLSQNRSGVRLSPDDLPSTALNDTDNDGLKEIVDGWGKAMVFARWPTGNTELTGMNPATANAKAARFADPLDPDGVLLNPNWYSLPNGNPNPLRLQFESLCHAISSNARNAYYILPTLGSGGRDGMLGIDLTTMATTNQTQASDNLYSYRLRLGAAGVAP